MPRKAPHSSTHPGRKDAGVRRLPDAQVAVELVSGSRVSNRPAGANLESPRGGARDDAARASQGLRQGLDEAGIADFDFHCRKKAPGVAAAVALYLTVVRNSAASSPKAPLRAKEAVAASASFRWDRYEGVRCGHTRPSLDEAQGSSLLTTHPPLEGRSTQVIDPASGRNSGESVANGGEQLVGPLSRRRMILLRSFERLGRPRLRQVVDKPVNARECVGDVGRQSPRELLDVSRRMSGAKSKDRIAERPPAFPKLVHDRHGSSVGHRSEPLWFDLVEQG